MKGFETHADCTCLACGCLCDDITVSVANNRIIAAERACERGLQWYLKDRDSVGADFQIEGRAATYDDCCARAADVLRAAKHPLVFGLEGASCEAQAAAVAIADRLKGHVDSHASPEHAAAVQAVGMASATLGEVRHRADLVIFWGVDPATTHPRHFERYSVTCTGEWTPRGRADRTIVVVDDRDTASAGMADEFLQIRTGSGALALRALRSLVLEKDSAGVDDLSAATGVEASSWQKLAERIEGARYGAFFFTPGDQSRALLELVKDLNALARFVALPLGAAANAAGAGQLLTWQTGHGLAIGFEPGYPQSDAAHWSAEALLSSGACDAVLVATCDPLVDPIGSLVARERLSQIPAIVLQTADYRAPVEPTVSFTVASAGIDDGGSVFRSDGVALPVRPVLSATRPRAEDVLKRLAELL